MPQLMPLNWMISVFMIMFLLLVCVYLYFYKMDMSINLKNNGIVLMNKVWEW